jgi:hypothetical protein
MPRVSASLSQRVADSTVAALAERGLLRRDSAAKRKLKTLIRDQSGRIARVVEKPAEIHQE